MKIKNIILENPESDNELFGRPTWTGHQARQELKNIDNAYVHATRQEFVNHVRDLAKNQFGVKTRVSAVAKKAGARTATFWFGSGEYVAGKPDKVVHKIKAELESQGFVCKFTDSGWLSVRVPDDYERNSIAEDQSDDELFGGSRGKKPLFTDEGLPKLDPDTQQQLLNATNKWLNELPRWSEWRELVNRQGGKDTAQEVMANFVKFRDYVEKNNIVAAIGSIQGTAHDWDDTFQSYLDENFGIDIWELIDLSDPDVDDAYSFYAGYRRLKENDVSDEDLFGTEASRKFAVVSPDGEILKQLENVTVKQAIEMAREVSAKYGDYYDDYGGIALIRSNIDGEYDEHYLEVPFSNEIDESQEPSDDELFAYRNPEAVRVDGRAVNMKSIRIEDIIHSDYPDFVDAYVDEATFRDGTPLSDQEREELEKVLRNAGVWETMIIDQAGSMLESDKSDDDLFGKTNLVDRIRMLIKHGQKVVGRALDATGPIVEVDDKGNLVFRHSTTRYHVGAVRANPDDYKLEQDPDSGIWYLRDKVNPFTESDKSDDDLFGASDNYTDYQGLRQSSLIFAYRNLYDKLYGHEDHYQGLDDHEADQERRRDERQLHKLLIHARSEYGEDFYQQLVDAPRKYRDRLLLPAFDHNILSDRKRLGSFNKRITKAGKLHGQDANMLKKDLKQWQGKHPKPDHLPESEREESDDELFGKTATAGTLKSSLIASMNAEASGQGEGGNDPEYTEYAAQIRDMIKKDFMLGAAYLWNQSSQGDGYAEQFINGAEGRGVDVHRIEKVLGLEDDEDDDADEYTYVDDMGIYRKRPQLESLINEYINMLTEAELAEPDEPERKAKTQTKQKSKLDPNMFAPKADQPLAKTDPLDDLKNKAGIGKDKPEVNIKKASQADTLKATGKIAPTDDMRDMLSRMRDIDIDPDLAGYPEPEPPETLPSVEVNTTNLPAVAGQALQAAGVQNPDFHQVANLPGNMADQIRQLGKSLFGALTMTPTKRIHVVANLGGQGPNTNQEVQAVAGFLKEHGEDLGPGDIDFDNVMPGYSAQTHMFNAAGIRWMLVKDFAGAYIYCWPEEDSVDASPKLSNNTDKKQLR